MTKAFVGPFMRSSSETPVSPGGEVAALGEGTVGVWVLSPDRGCFFALSILHLAKMQTKFNHCKVFLLNPIKRAIKQKYLNIPNSEKLVEYQIFICVCQHSLSPKAMCKIIVCAI